MPVVALITWIITALGGLYLLAVWLIEYDPDFQRSAATRLPIPLISGHVLFAIGGLVIWLMYLITGEDVFAWATIAVLVFVATFGLTMAVRWIGVYRAGADLAGADLAGANLAGVDLAGADLAGAYRAGSARTPDPAVSVSQGSGALAVPPERHFPLSVVIGHGLFAVTTIVLVVLTLLGVGGS